MDDENKLKKILDEFFANASEKDLLEFSELLKNRGGKNLFGKLKLNEVAVDMASSIQKHVGLTSENIARMSRNLVRGLIIQYDPNMPNHEIEAHVNRYVSGKRDTWKKIPPEMLTAMISQFTAYGRGELKESNMAEFPDGWIEKYWNIFPVEIQKLIRAYIKDQINSRQFWESVQNFLMPSK